MKQKIVNCKKCNCKRIYKYSHSESFYPMRGLLAIMTFGISELTVTKYYQCSICGEIIDDKFI